MHDRIEKVVSPCNEDVLHRMTFPQTCAYGKVRNVPDPGASVLVIIGRLVEFKDFESSMV